MDLFKGSFLKKLFYKIPFDGCYQNSLSYNQVKTYSLVFIVFDEFWEQSMEVDLNVEIWSESNIKSLFSLVQLLLEMSKYCLPNLRRHWYICKFKDFFVTNFSDIWFIILFQAKYFSNTRKLFRYFLFVSKILFTVL